MPPARAVLPARAAADDEIGGGAAERVGEHLERGEVEIAASLLNGADVGAVAATAVGQFLLAPAVSGAKCDQVVGDAVQPRRAGFAVAVTRLRGGSVAAVAGARG